MKHVYLLMILSLITFNAISQVRLTEIHYDNAGGDVDEFVEVSGIAGTDLTGWKIEFYNGSSTQLNVYSTLNLSGTIPDEGGGYGALAFYKADIQNGAPDGFALIDNNDILIEFFSYEGTFTPTSGTATGVLSIDIGVSETGTTPIGHSLQRTDVGTWVGPATHSFGTLNTGINTSFLPIELTTFNATPHEDGIVLFWRTEMEINNDFMAVERSSDGKDFEEIGIVEGQGTSLEPNEYQFIDVKPLNGTNYYRLRQVDYDGTYEYHSIVAADFETTFSEDILILPNIVHSAFNVIIPSTIDGKVQMLIYDMNGQQVHTEVFQALGTNNINIEYLPSGIYVIQFITQSGTKTKRLVKE